ncbi:MAG: FAD-binding protein [Deltaproteobacteria bacterium]|nr:FAD-binding protein [Deltaproteobacteria bacterium]
MKRRFQIASNIECDVLVIGAGGAGLRFAAHVLEKRPEARILAVTKVAHPQKSHTNTAQGGLAAVDPDDPLDDLLYHMFDTWKGSDCSADQNVIRKIVESAWDQVIWLENHGMHFSRNEEGRLSKRTFGGHTLRFGETSAFRAIYEADRTGKGIMDTLWFEAVKGGITFLNQSIAAELLFRGNRCVGALLFRQKEGEFVLVLSKATVLATGGSGQLYRVTTNCRQNTGDGLAVVLRAGLPLMDPEAVQFHPTGIVGPGILASETLRSVGGILRNRDMEAFMERYAPAMKELAPRDLVSRAIETEIREGRGILNPDHNIEHVWIDLRHLSDYVHEVQIPEVSGFFKKFVNLDPRKDLCPVRPSNHYHMGGIPTDEFGQVTGEGGRRIDSLYAVGECAAASFHGFNRLGTNSLLELITMGKIAGEKALESLEEGLESPEEDPGSLTFPLFSAFLEAKGGENTGEIRRELQSLMTEKVGIFRTESGLAQAMEALRELKERAQGAALHKKGLTMNQELIQRWELENLLSLAMVTAAGALERRESRGAHFREDHPERSDDFNHHTLAYMRDFDQVKLGKRPIDMSLCQEGGPHSEKFGMLERKY